MEAIQAAHKRVIVAKAGEGSIKFGVWCALLSLWSSSSRCEPASGIS